SVWGSPVGKRGSSVSEQQQARGCGPIGLALWQESNAQHEIAAMLTFGSRDCVPEWDGGPLGQAQEIAMICNSLSPEPAESPMALPISDFATGEANEIEPAFGSASSSPTMRNVCTRPSVRLNDTVLPNATTSADGGFGLTCAVRSRSEK